MSNYDQICFENPFEYSDNGDNVPLEMDYVFSLGEKMVPLSGNMEGDYDFEVTGSTIDPYQGSMRSVSCTRVRLTFKVYISDTLTTRASDYLYLTTRGVSRINHFLKSLGYTGDVKITDWAKVKGKHGRAHFKYKTFIGDDGCTCGYNSVEKYIDKEEK